MAIFWGGFAFGVVVCSVVALLTALWSSHNYDKQFKIIEEALDERKPS